MAEYPQRSKSNLYAHHLYALLQLQWQMLQQMPYNAGQKILSP